MKLQIQALVYFLILPSAVSAICYFPNGFTTPQNVPCENNHDSPCCPPGYACLSNGLCVKTDATNETVGYIRGSCTDKSWRSSYCPNFCVRGGPPWNDSLSKIQPMRKCENTNEDIYYCVDNNTKAVDCAKQSAVVSFAGQPTTVTVIGATQTSQASSTAIAPGQNGSGSGSYNATAIGVGVGVSVGVILLALVAFFFWRRRRQHNRALEALPPYLLGDKYRGERQAYKWQSNEAADNSVLNGQPVEAPGSEVGELAGDTIPLRPIELPAVGPR